MALADYRLCDWCGNKAFYDSRLNYDYDEKTGQTTLDHLGDWKVLCVECAKTHEVVIRERAAAAKEQE